MAKRIINAETRYKELMRCILSDNVSEMKNVKELRSDLYEFSNDMKFKKARSMGQILKTALNFVKRNYEDVNTKRILQEGGR